MLTAVMNGYALGFGIEGEGNQWRMACSSTPLPISPKAELIPAGDGAFFTSDDDVEIRIHER